jgi:hypothetical protein
MCGHGKFLRTDLLRVVLTQELQVVLERLPPADNRVRVVTPIIPQGAAVLGVLDPADADVLSSKGYNFVPLANGQTLEVPLAPGQVLALACEGNTVVMGLAIEWYAGVTA